MTEQVAAVNPVWVLDAMCSSQGELHALGLALFLPRDHLYLS